MRTDSAGASNALINEMTALGVEYSLGFPITESVRTAVGMLPSGVWTSAITAEGAIRGGADVAEITGLLTRRGWPESMRVIVHRERPHPGAQLSLFEERDGCRVVSILRVCEPVWRRS